MTFFFFFFLGPFFSKEQKMFHFTAATNPKVSNWPLHPEKNIPSQDKKPKEQDLAEKK